MNAQRSTESRVPGATGRPLLPAALPAFCTARVILITLMFGAALALLLALVPGQIGDRWTRFGTILWLVTWVSLVTVAILCAARDRLARLKLAPLLTVILLVLLLVTAVTSVLAYQALLGVGWQANESIWRFTAHNLVIALIVGLIGIWVFSLHLANARQLNARSEAELSALHARIRPHFLFNSLNTVAELIASRPEEAERAVLDLSRLFRAAMTADDVSPLAEEIDLTRRYLDIEGWRLGPRLEVDWQLSEPLPDAVLPILTLQPLVENAVRHGVERLPAPGPIRIECRTTRDRLHLSIENDCPGPDADHPGNGMALVNIRDRLALVYGDEASLLTVPTDKRFRVELIVPIGKGSKR
ncbi:MAG: sensor histidine kinase [Pseudomonadota bacterium]